MSGEFSLIPIERLCRWTLSELEEKQQIFGIHQDLFFRPRSDDPFRMQRYGVHLETPLGVAAGPHTQMAQNIIVAWLCGSRYIELKTVQTLDELNVSKPCIDMEDEGYNCEWSQELKLHDSYSEYLNAWIMLHLLRHRLGWTDAAPDRGFIFNMSVGYNMEGILKDNVQTFLARMENGREEKEARVAAVARLYPAIRDIEIPDRMSDNITLSTMHGCPPHEIEQIGLYLIEQKKLHTTIKLNPTLLGPEELRRILNDEMGFATNVPDEAFGHDLKYADALGLIRNLRDAARRTGVHFALKLTNTLESVNHKSVFPPNEKMMYMSGRALHPISIRVARKLQDAFDGELDISFCAGVDAFNLPDVLACGLRPVTVCSDILKPGGYARKVQSLEKLREAMREAGASTLESFAEKRAQGRPDPEGRHAAHVNLRAYADAVTSNPLLRKEGRDGELIKTRRRLEAFDCVQAPCVVTCPTHQDIPQYLYHAARGEYTEAMRVILKTNPFPHVCGMVCDHPCQMKCTRINYDNPILIREVKRFIAEQAPAGTIDLKPAEPNGLKVAVIGAGPSGLSCAYYLALGGFAVDVYETKQFAGGMLSDAIPAFRLSDEAIRNDISHIESVGVKIHLGQPIDGDHFVELHKQVDYIYLAIGAQGAKRLGIPGEDGSGSYDCLRFLSEVRQGKVVDLGRRVVVLGGGNSAIDAARTARRLVGQEGEVTLLYRRTRREMPADHEEIVAMLEEGVKLHELSAPVSLKRNGNLVGLVAEKMRLGEPDASGRRRPERVPDSAFEIACDSVIAAIGQELTGDLVEDLELLRADPVTGETRYPGVFIGGDANRGPATVVEAIGDGRRVAANIERKAAERLGCLKSGADRKDVSPVEHQRKRARREYGEGPPALKAIDVCQGCGDLVSRTLTVEEARREGERCLYCDDVCDQCVTVCPNRANLSYSARMGDYPVMAAVSEDGALRLEAAGTFRVAQSNQILNVGDFCNECGNCTTFCPTSGEPYRQKPKFYLTEESFRHEQDGYHLAEGGRVLRARVDGREERLTRQDGGFLYETEAVTAHLDGDSLRVRDVVAKGACSEDLVSLGHAVRMAVMLEALAKAPFAAG